MAKIGESHKLEPQDWFPRVPNALAFIIYRVLPICSLSMMAYGLAQQYGFYRGLMFIILVNPTIYGFTVGILITGCFIFEYTAEEAPSRAAWVDMLRLKIEDHVATRRSLPFGFRTPRTPESARKEIQLHKERIATYLSGSRQGIPPFISRREALYLKLMYFPVAIIGLRIVCGDFPEVPEFSAILDSLTRQNLPSIVAYCCAHMLWTLFSIQLGRCSGWLSDLSVAGRAIRKACEDVDIEKGRDTREELEWWIEAVLTEESDSPALAKERREVIIAPILGMIVLKENGDDSPCILNRLCQNRLCHGVLAVFQATLATLATFHCEEK